MANKFLDNNGLLYFWQKIVNKFVAKEEGKSLSSNDYTTNEKTKLSGIAEGANKTIIQDNLSSTSPTDALSANQGKILDDKIKAINQNMGNLGGGDMMKSEYDVDGNGQVDKADDSNKLGGQLPSHYAKAEDLNKYVPTSTVGQSNGVASLGADGKVPKSQLPETAPIEHEHEVDDVNGLRDELDDIVEIANGKCNSYVFDTVEELDTWLSNAENTSKLKTGDVFYIRAVDIPDYWWDSNTNSKQILETTKLDLTVITNAEIDAIVAS